MAQIKLGETFLVRLFAHHIFTIFTISTMASRQVQRIMRDARDQNRVAEARRQRANDGSAASLARHRMDHNANERIVAHEQYIYASNKNMGETNTNKAYNPKILEFEAFCHSCYSHQPVNERTTVENGKVFMFMCYVAMRPPKPRGRKKQSTSISHFNRAEYDEINEKYFPRTMPGTMEEQIDALPKTCTGSDLFNTYKSAIKALYTEQNMKQINARVWDTDIWRSNCAELQKHVRKRRNRVKKRHHGEKTTTHTTFFEADGMDVTVENEMWANSKNCRNIRESFTHLR